MTNRLQAIRVLVCVGLVTLMLACGAPMASTEAQPSVETMAPAEGEPAPTYTAPATAIAILLTPTALPSATAASSLPGQEVVQPQPAIIENRRLTLEFPAVMRLGDTTRIRLQLEVDDLGNITPTAVVEGNVVTGEVVQIPNLYDSHNVIAEARLDLAGMVVQPSQTISEPLSPGRAATFYWSVRPAEAGNYQGSVWLHLRFLPKSGGSESRIPLSVQFIDIRVNAFLGLLTGGAARSFGAVGSAIGTVLGIPFVGDFSKWILRRIWGKRRMKS